MNRFLTPMLALPLLAAPVAAAVYGGSNFGSFAYPSHNCGVPAPAPQRPYNMTSVRDVEAYNRLVDRYNLQIQSFSECINGYVNRAELDMQRIREQANQAIEDLRRANSQARH